MNFVAVLLPALLVYLALLFWCYRYFNLKQTWTGENIELVQSIEKPMLNFVKGLLSFFTVFLLLICLVIPPITVVLSLSQGASPTWGVDISIYAGFSLDLNAISGIEVDGLRNPELSGKSTVFIDTSNPHAFYLFMFSQMAMALVSLYVVVQLRSLLMSLKNGNAFCFANAKILKQIGYTVIVFNLISPFFQYFAWGSVIAQIDFSNQGLALYPAWDFDLLAMFIGAMMIILSDLFLEATMISQEQRLTI